MPDSSMIHVPPAPARRPRIAIISTYDDLCGIAGYTRALERQLAPHAEVTVFDLDQYLLRSRYRRIQRLADAHIREMAAALAAFDSVNIQLEYGTLGQTVRQIYRRFRWLALAAPALSVTLHTVQIGEGLPWQTLSRLLATGKLAAAGEVLNNAWRGKSLGHGIQRLLRRLQRKKPVSVIVHTKRDMRLVSDLYGIERVHHHPLSYIPRHEAQALRARVSRADFPLAAQLPANARLIGTFGFLSAYKGFDTAIQALYHLPEDYHLLIFGGLHPQGIRCQEVISPYVQALLRAAHIGHAPLDQLKESGLRLAPGGGELGALLADHPKSLQKRVHFMGALPDERFYAAMALCDVAVMPYREVGQASSGPISMALEMGTPIIASRTAAFRAFARYHPGQVEFFDIGNFAELASRILASRLSAGIPVLRYNTQSNVRMYLEANNIPSAAETPLETLPCAAE